MPLIPWRLLSVFKNLNYLAFDNLIISNPSIAMGQYLPPDYTQYFPAPAPVPPENVPLNSVGVVSLVRLALASEDWTWFPIVPNMAIL